MAKKPVHETSTTETTQVLNIPVEKLYLGTNLSRDSIGGAKGHTEADISQLKHAILETGFLINPIVVGPMGYRDENHPETAPDQYPVFAGFGRSQAFIGLRNDYASDARWATIPAKVVPLTEGEEATAKAEKINWFENVRIAQTSIAFAQMWAQMQAKGIQVNQIAAAFNVSPAKVSQQSYLMFLPAHMQEMIVQGEKKLAPFNEGTFERNGMKMQPLRASFVITVFGALNKLYKEASKIPATIDYTNFANALYAHWEKSGQWDDTVAKNYLDGVRAKFGMEPKEGRPRAKKEDETTSTNTTPNTSSNTAPANNGGTTPGNGADAGMGRADKSGDPTKEGQSVRESKQAEGGKEEYYPLLGAGLALATYLKGTDIPALKAIGEVATLANFGKLPNGVYGLSPASRTALDNVIKEHFPKVTSATN